jgi:hypothetical protein
VNVKLEPRRVDMDSGIWFALSQPKSGAEREIQIIKDEIAA